MFNGRRIIAVIPARGGSKGIPHKNIIDLCGIPLIGYTIKAACQSKYIDYVMVSTDDKDIARVSRDYGADIPFLRPSELASDTSKTIDAILHTLMKLKELGEVFQDLVLLQPTQPLRTASDIDCALRDYYINDKMSLVSVSEVDDHPLLIRTIKNNKLEPILKASSTCRRQDMPKYYRVNGCIYINNIDEINKDTSFNDNIIPYVMEKSHSVDIDDLRDLALAKYYLEKNDNYEI